MAKPIDEWCKMYSMVWYQRLRPPGSSAPLCAPIAMDRKHTNRARYQYMPWRQRLRPAGSPSVRTDW